jgi:hypothetical protein
MWPLLAVLTETIGILEHIHGILVCAVKIALDHINAKAVIYSVPCVPEKF